MSIKKRREIFDLKEGGIAAAAKSETGLMQVSLTSCFRSFKVVWIEN